MIRNMSPEKKSRSLLIFTRGLQGCAMQL